MSPRIDLFPREQPHDPEGTFVDTPRGRVHVVVDGDLARGPALVFVHGIPGNTRDARYLGPALARRGLACIRVDMPGFGKTARDTAPAPEAIERAAFVRYVARALGCERFAVAGHSVGGAVALACAARFPDDVSALVLVNSVGVRRHRGLVLPTSAHRALSLAAATPLGHTMARVLERYYDGRGTRSDSPVDAATFAHHLAIVASLDFVEQRAHTRMVRCPTLVVSCDDDAFVEAPVADTLVDALSASAPWVTHIRAPRGGHHGQKIAAAPIAEWLAVTLQDG